uniref:Putative sodium-dependent multivitamin transporter n=1 Tax=Ixodes ricinus TaxID=34613 RepID=A0A6B0UU13_IXORI
MSFAVEYAVFTVVMLANLGLGLYFALFKRLRDQSTGELFLGNRTLKTIPLALSVFASTISSVSVVAITGHFYAYGFHFAWGAVAAFLVLPVSFLVIIPVLYRLKVTSIFELWHSLDTSTPTDFTLLGVQWLHSWYCQYLSSS